MTTIATKEELFRNAGYRYNFDRGLYLNRKEKKAFSVKFIEDHSVEDLQRNFQEPAAEEWRFFFNEPPSPTVKQILANLLG